ncbi:MAG: hypothetical protein II994_00360 [Lachnospiraceae bacterium]|nr:hypothetical protein [Lachnospiraceae bacterium]
MNQGGLLKKKIAYPLFVVIGFLLVFVWKAESDLAERGNILWTGSYTWGLLALSLVLGGVLGVLVCSLVYRLAGKKTAVCVTGKCAAWVTALSDRKTFLLALAGILLSWLPTYLAYYPSICSYDTPIQLGQVFEGYYIDHHPIAHTLILRVFINLGRNVFGSAGTGMAFYGAFQMTLLAISFAFGIRMVHSRKLGVKWEILLLLYSMFYPFHWYMAVSSTKDTVFSSFFVILMVALADLLWEGRNDFKIKSMDGVLFFSTIGMILFRNNGKYAMMVLLVLLIPVLLKGNGSRKLWMRLGFNLLLAFVVGNLLLSGIFKATGAEQGDRREMLSLPIQQFSRCMIYHGGVGVLPEDDNTLDESSKQLINDFILNEGYRDYDPHISDPVKRAANTYAAKHQAKNFVTTYLKLLAEYPGDFINAGLAVNAGYLYPNDVSHAYINVEEGKQGRGYIQTYWLEEELNDRGIYKDSKWPGLYGMLEKWADENGYLKLPLLKYLFVPGTYFWAYLIFAAVLLVLKRYRMLLPLSLVLGYYITLFLGPTVQLRYLYPVMIVLPFMMVLSKKGKAL